MMNKSRVEALTDGIVAIAATIMVLELGVPAMNNWTGLMSQSHTFLAYVNIFFMIYNVWYLHHNLFNRAEVLSRKAFLINGIWIFLLTLVPFTTAWVGKAPSSFLPEFLYPLNLLLWSVVFNWLEIQIEKDNPDKPSNRSNLKTIRIIIYSCHTLCLVLAFIKPILSISLVGVSALSLIIWIFRRGNSKEQANAQPSGIFFKQKTAERERLYPSAVLFSDAFPDFGSHTGLRKPLEMATIWAT